MKRDAYKRVIRYPDCRCNGFYYGADWRTDPWDYSPERGEWVPVRVCKKGLGCTRWVPYEYSPVRRCGHCGRLGWSRYIKVRNDCYLHGVSEDTPILCMACWNRYRPVIAGLRMLRVCQSLANKIRRRAQQKRAG